MTAKKSWKDMTPDEKARDKQLHKRRKYLRDSGRPSLVPAGPARRRLTALSREYAVSSRNIAEGAGLSQSTISDLLRGHRSPGKGGNEITEIPRTTHDAVMAYEPDAVLYNPDARVDATGSRRRLQALAYAGYSNAQLGAFAGNDSHESNWTWRIMRSISRSGAPAASYVHAKTRDAVTELYVKYRDTSPADVGGTPMSIGRAKNAARRHSYPPAHCWDDDTIDDPDAIPEWTGECGTPTGYYLHLKYDICVATVHGATPGRKSADGTQRLVTCQPCRDAHISSAGSASIHGTDQLGIMDALKGGMSRRAIAAEFYVSWRTVHRVALKLKETGWVAPPSGPRPGPKKAA